VPRRHAPSRGALADPKPQHFPPLTREDRLEASRFVHAARPAEVAGVVRFGCDVRVPLYPCGAARWGVFDHPVEERGRRVT